jgi:hypothetical protein
MEGTPKINDAERQHYNRYAERQHYNRVTIAGRTAAFTIGIPDDKML